MDKHDCMNQVLKSIKLKTHVTLKIESAYKELVPFKVTENWQLLLQTMRSLHSINNVQLLPYTLPPYCCWFDFWNQTENNLVNYCQASVAVSNDRYDFYEN